MTIAETRPGHVPVEVKVGKVIECQLSPEQLEEIDKEIAEIMKPQLEKLEALKKITNNPNPLTFHQPMTY